MLTSVAVKAIRGPVGVCQFRQAGEWGNAGIDVVKVGLLVSIGVQRHNVRVLLCGIAIAFDLERWAGGHGGLS